LTKEAANNPIAFEAFMKEMEGREYGADATLTAWLWFEKGWEARK
jgi:hypothetical protein